MFYNINNGNASKHCSKTHSCPDEVQRVGIDDPENAKGPRRPDNVQLSRETQRHQKIPPEVRHNRDGNRFTPAHQRDTACRSVRFCREVRDEGKGGTGTGDGW